MARAGRWWWGQVGSGQGEQEGWGGWEGKGARRGRRGQGGVGGARRGQGGEGGVGRVGPGVSKRERPRQTHIRLAGGGRRS
eukprot:5815653-Pleurochrysis_carterae.AAC.1